MNLLSLVVVLFLEQFRPLAYKQVVATPVYALAHWLEQNFNAGRYRHGVLAWLLAVLPIAALSGLVFYLLLSVNLVLAWLWNVLMLYLALGFRQFSACYTAIHKALGEGDLPEARRQLAGWLRQPNHQVHTRQNERLVIAELNASAIARLAIEEALSASHRHVFGVLLFFIILPGPMGAVFYRLVVVLAEIARNNRHEDNEEYGRFALNCLQWVDWLPARITAMSFAICGNFEDAAHCWLNQAQVWPDRSDPNLGVILASGAGALGVQFSFNSIGPERIEDSETSEISEDLELGAGENPNTGAMQRAVGLVWRAVLLWLCLLLLFALAVGVQAVG